MAANGSSPLSQEFDRPRDSRDGVRKPATGEHVLDREHVLADDGPRLPDTGVTESAQTSSSEHCGIVITQELGSPGGLDASEPSHLPEGDRVSPNRMAEGNHRELVYRETDRD